MNLLGRATSLLPPGDALRLEFLSELGVAYRLAGELTSAAETLATAIDEARSVGDRRLELRADWEQQAVRLSSEPEGEARRLVEIAERAVAVFEAVGDERGLGRAWYLTGFVQGSFYCRNLVHEDALERALGHYTPSAQAELPSLSGSLFGALLRPTVGGRGAPSLRRAART